MTPLCFIIIKLDAHFADCVSSGASLVPMLSGFKAGMNLESLEQMRDANLIIVMEVLSNLTMFSKFLNRSCNGALK